MIDAGTNGPGFMFGGMPRTIGYHVVITGYGLWLPGDARGHWSTAWDDRIGYTEPHALHRGDPVRLRMARERMRHGAVLLTERMINVFAQILGRCADRSDWRIAAISIEASHTHLLLTYTKGNIHNTVKWIKDRATKTIHHETHHVGPVWCAGKWCGFIFDSSVWRNTQRYIERHNLRRGEAAQPYSFVSPHP